MASISHLVRITSTLADTYTALTSNQAIAQWFTETQCDRWAIGSAVVWFDETHMTISELIPNEVLSFHVSQGSGWDGTDIRFELEQVDDRTLVRFDHDNWDEVTDHFRDCSMSWAYFLESLKQYIETGVGTPEDSAPACESDGGSAGT